MKEPREPRYILTTNTAYITRLIRMEAQLVLDIQMSQVNKYTYHNATQLRELASAYITAGINPRASFVLTELIHQTYTSQGVCEALVELEPYMIDPHDV